ncbi:hypothetical protein BaRGS_00027606 [Batillaria attramentaria]|uniref:Uncharacterized protein n=1 Tax=Batillaria attramentaria TaxID=370345 RepID=A0ABD0K203_9CAEN
MTLVSSDGSLTLSGQVLWQPVLHTKPRAWLNRCLHSKSRSAHHKKDWHEQHGSSDHMQIPYGEQLVRIKPGRVRRSRNTNSVDSAGNLAQQGQSRKGKGAYVEGNCVARLIKTNSCVRICGLLKKGWVELAAGDSTSCTFAQ